ncbi:MAG TPA: response regulator [Firmicutes bacterium]|nr:response regulator [Bacillota bacterium]
MNELILIVEDEKDLVKTLEYNLQQNDFSTQSALNGKDAIKLLEKEPLPDLVLLDLMLPDISGYEVCRFLKGDSRTKNIPVIMLTARTEEIDRILGFELGADDYVPKPFSVRELLLRIKAVLRRLKSEDDEKPKISIGVLSIDSPGHRVWVEGEEVTLTALEFRLLENLVSRRGRVQTRDMLLSDVWGIDADVTTRTVDTHIKRLREKLGPAGEHIETIRGVGYRFRTNIE